jgi:hypothetical protein
VPYTRMLTVLVDVLLVQPGGFATFDEEFVFRSYCHLRPELDIVASLDLFT